MDPTEILGRAYNLFLISEIIENESDIDKEIEGLLVDRDYNNMAFTSGSYANALKISALISNISLFKSNAAFVISFSI